MTPCQLSIEVEHEIEPEIVGKSVGSNQDMTLKCMSNCQDTAFDMEAALLDQKPKELMGLEDMEVDIVGLKGKEVMLEREEEEETDETEEYSSSFGNTCSGNEDGERLSDSEVDSIYGDSNLFVGFDSMFPMGKKKVTAHWRKYISPLTWRGKWVELRMKEMKSQLLKYDRELSSYGQREQLLEFGQCTPEDCSVKSLPFLGQNHKKEVMKRRKRKKTEEMADVSLYMSHHNLFSYYENKRSDTDGASMDDDAGIQVIPADVNSNDDFDVNNACPSLELGDENSLEHVLWKIDMVQSRVQKLKTQIDKLLTLHAGKFSSVDSLTELAPSDVPASPGSPALSPGNVERIPIGASYSPPRHTADYPPVHIAENPESAVSSYGEAATHPDIIECAVSPLTEEVCLDQSYFAESLQNTVSDPGVKKEPEEIEKVNNGHPRVPVKEENTIHVPPKVVAVKPEPCQEASTSRESSVPITSLASEFLGLPTKRKRGERKAGNWDKIVPQITPAKLASG